MRKRKYLLVATFVLIFSPALLAADTYAIDVANSMLSFTVRHMLINNVRGNFRDFTGTIAYDPQDLTKSSVEVNIKSRSIDSGNENRDTHLRSADFFDVDKFPEITFKSTSIEKSGDGYIAHGPLTMHGVSKEVAIPFSITGTVKDARGKTHLGVEAALTINRVDYGLTWNRTLEGGGVLVSDEVKIDLGIEATKQ
jgi:polyisoprenoid-binding protein YceI